MAHLPKATNILIQQEHKKYYMTLIQQEQNMTLGIKLTLTLDLSL